MSYRLDLDEVMTTIASLPLESLLPLQEAWVVLELTPWAGPPWATSNPEGAVRFVAFGDGRGTLVYLILEDQRTVDVLEIFWV